MRFNLDTRLCYKLEEKILRKHKFILELDLLDLIKVWSRFNLDTRLYYRLEEKILSKYKLIFRIRFVKSDRDLIEI